VLIQKMAHPALARSPSKRTPVRGGKPLSGRVLDIGCGKGGYLRKWYKARIRDYIGVDIATVSVNQARDRWEDMKGDRFDAWFSQLDCYQVSHLLLLTSIQLTEQSCLGSNSAGGSRTISR